MPAAEATPTVGCYYSLELTRSAESILDVVLAFLNRNEYDSSERLPISEAKMGGGV